MRTNRFMLAACYVCAFGLQWCIRRGDYGQGFILGSVWLIAAGMAHPRVRMKQGSASSRLVPIEGRGRV